jgi:hypothetical protein
MKPFVCSADMHEPSSKHTPIIPSGTPGEISVSHSLPTSAQLRTSASKSSCIEIPSIPAKVCNVYLNVRPCVAALHGKM